MLAVDPNGRPTAKQLLRVIAQFVDVEAKTRMIEQARLVGIQHKAEEPRQAFEQDEQFTIKGPFNSWVEFERAIAKATRELRPRFFSVDVNFNDGSEFVYCQAYNTKPDWALECMSDKFSSFAHGDQIRASFMNLGWNPPTEDSPNYQRDLKQVDTKKMAGIFVDAFTLGYGIKLEKVASFTLKAVGLGHYEDK